MDYNVIFQRDIERARELARLREARLAAGEMRAGAYGTEREYWQSECDRLDNLIKQAEAGRY